MAKTRFIFICLILLILSSTAYSEELKYNFKLGRTYKYTYENRVSSKTSYFEKNIKNSQKSEPTEISIKAIAFDNEAYVLDISSFGKTVRRYVKTNGELKGSPSEAGQRFPFFLTLPVQDIKEGMKIPSNHSIILGKHEFPASRILTIKKINSEEGTAELTFQCSVKLPEIKTGKKKLIINGNITFDLLEGIVKSANWSSKYSFDYKNKQLAIVRDLWKFANEQHYSIKLTKMED